MPFRKGTEILSILCLILGRPVQFDLTPIFVCASHLKIVLNRSHMHNSELCTFRPFGLNWYYRNQTLLLLVRRNNYWLLQINNIFENVYVILVFAMNCLEFIILGLSQVNWRIEYVNVNSNLLLIFPVQWFSTDYVFQLWQSPVTPGNLVNKSLSEFYFN